MAFSGIRNLNTGSGGRVEFVANDQVVLTLWGDASPLYIQKEEGVLQIRRVTDGGVFLSMWESVV